MRDTLSTKQAAKLLGVTTLTIHRWVKAGRLPDRRIPGARKHVFLRSDLMPSTLEQEGAL